MGQEITLINPHHGVAWRRHLDWMIHTHPAITKEMFLKGELFEYLNTFIAYIGVYRGAMLTKGIPKTVAEENIAARLIGAERMMKSGQGLPLDSHIIELINDSVESMADNTVTIQVS